MWKSSRAAAQHRRKIANAMFESGSKNGAIAGRRWSAVSQGDGLQGTGSAWVAQLVERVLGKDEVTGSIPVPGSRFDGFPRGDSGTCSALGKRVLSC